MARRGQIGRNELYRLAQLGAQARLAELDRERAEILRNFPALASRTRTGSRTASVGNGAGPRRRRNRMSAAARKAVSVRMKKYWANYRKTHAKSA